jgi:hypothetical protein
VVDDPDDDRRNALERQLLSLLAGFQRLHRVSYGEMCDLLIDCADWLCCPDRATRIYLPAYDMPMSCEPKEEEEAS